MASARSTTRGRPQASCRSGGPSSGGPCTPGRCPPRDVGAEGVVGAEAVPLGPDQAAARLGVRRTDFDHVVRLGLITPAGSAEVDYGRAAGGVTTVPLYNARDVALLRVVVSSVDWRAVALTGPGRRSPLAALTPAQEPHTLFLAGVAQIVGVGRAAVVVGWRRRHPDFPPAVGGTDVSPTFDTAAVVAWLLAHDKIQVPTAEPTSARGTHRSASRTRTWSRPRTRAARTGWRPGSPIPSGSGHLVTASFAAGAAVNVPGRKPLSLLGGVRLADKLATSCGWRWLTSAWPPTWHGSRLRRRCHGPAFPAGVTAAGTT